MPLTVFVLFSLVRTSDNLRRGVNVLHKMQSYVGSYMAAVPTLTFCCQNARVHGLLFQKHNLRLPTFSEKPSCYTLSEKLTSAPRR
jgi:hypothetical protein